MLGRPGARDGVIRVEMRALVSPENKLGGYALLLLFLSLLLFFLVFEIMVCRSSSDAEEEWWRVSVNGGRGLFHIVSVARYVYVSHLWKSVHTYECAHRLSFCAERYGEI